MSDSPAPRNPGFSSTDLEKRADVDALETLHFERRAIAAVLHKLQAVYGSFGTFDAQRKSLVEAQKVKHRNALAESGQKTTEGMIDALAYSDPVYVAFLDQAVVDRVEMLRLELRDSEMQNRLRNRDLSLMSYMKEISLVR